MNLIFSDFWPTWNNKDNIFTKVISLIPKKENSSTKLLIYSCFGNDHLDFKGPRLFYTGENIRPDWNACDFAVSFDYPVTDRNYRLPLYGLGDMSQLLRPKDANRILASKTKFCNFVVSNPQGSERNRFFKKLSKYKKVDSGGKYLNNIGGPVSSKSDFIKDFKFTISFENESFPGYTTEKIVEPMLMDSLPIYWGNPLVAKDFNSESFINVMDFSNMDDAIEKIIELDKNDDLYLNYMNKPYFINNELNEFINPNNLLNWFANLLSIIPNIEIAAFNPAKNKLAAQNYKNRRRLDKLNFLIRSFRRNLHI